MELLQNKTTHPEAPGPDLAWRFAGAWLRIARIMRCGLDQAFSGEEDFNAKDYFLLRWIHDGLHYPGALSEQTMMPASMISHQLERLLRAGWLSRQIDRQDARRTRFELTETGRKALERGDRLVGEVIQSYLARVPLERREEFISSCERLAEGPTGASHV